jgi:Fe-S-cluster formation regulator IscX/YfhJ
MTAEYSEERLDLVTRFSVSTSADVTIQIAERDGHQFIVIKEQHPAETSSATQQIIEIPAALLPELKRAVAALEENFDDDQDSSEPVRRPVNFAHQSEQEFANILDFYHIAWQYEPRTFPIEWDAEGNVVKSFTPDFYLPEHNLYIELTTLKQSLVTKKNRKVRKLRELYPDVNIKVLYASDYRKLVEKFAGSSPSPDKVAEDILGLASARDEEQETEQE